MRVPKLVAFDVDGTLLDSAGACRPSTQRTLAGLRTAEIPIAIATGRPLGLAAQTIDEVGGADWAACANGASLVEVRTGVLHRDACVPAELVEPLILGVRKSLPGVGFALETTEGDFEEAGLARRVSSSPYPPPIADVLKILRGIDGGIRRVISFHDDFDDKLDALGAIVEPFIDNRCELHYGAFPIVEVAIAGGHKAVALQVAVDHLGIDPQDVVAVGDARNDIEMLRWAGTGVAMGNAADEVKQAADAVTGHVDDEGIAAYFAPLLGHLHD